MMRVDESSSGIVFNETDSLQYRHLPIIVYLHIMQTHVITQIHNYAYVYIYINYTYRVYIICTHIIYIHSIYYIYTHIMYVYIYICHTNLWSQTKLASILTTTTDHNDKTAKKSLTHTHRERKPSTHAATSFSRSEVPQEIDIFGRDATVFMALRMVLLVTFSARVFFYLPNNRGGVVV